MSYVSKNEPSNFRYDDCVINEVKWKGNTLSFLVEALIVKANNSQNTNFTESYAGDTRIAFDNAKITKIIKEGYKKYDANDNLLEAIEDKEVSADEVELCDFGGQYLISLQQIDTKLYSVEVEYADEDPSVITDVYELTIEADSVIATWDRYMNRVQN